MKKNKYLFSSGEFAKLNGINKRTLHYYNDIGLFCPEITGENGYHYYTCFQTIQLEMILLFRKLGLSIEDIKAYTSNPSDASFRQILTAQKEVIDQSIQQLLEAKAFLQQKQDKLELGLSAYHGKIEKLKLPEQKILLSRPISGTYDENDFAIATEFSMTLKKLFGLYDNFGSRISFQCISEGKFDDYDRFFAYTNPDFEQYDEILPAGTYLRAYSIGDWAQLKEVYHSLIQYAKTHGLTLSGYAYEEGLNEMALEKNNDYITMITIACT